MRIGGDPNSKKIISGQVDSLLKQNPETRLSKFFKGLNTPVYSDKLNVKGSVPQGTQIPKQPPVKAPKRLNIIKSEAKGIKRVM